MASPTIVEVIGRAVLVQARAALMNSRNRRSQKVTEKMPDKAPKPPTAKEIKEAEALAKAIAVHRAKALSRWSRLLLKVRFAQIKNAEDYQVALAAWNAEQQAKVDAHLAHAGGRGAVLEELIKDSEAEGWEDAVQEFDGVDIEGIGEVAP